MTSILKKSNKCGGGKGRKVEGGRWNGRKGGREWNEWKEMNGMEMDSVVEGRKWNGRKGMSASLTVENVRENHFHRLVCGGSIGG